MTLGFIGPSNKNGKAFLERQARLKQASLHILDEMSMLSRMMLGKISYRVEEALGVKSGSLGGRDCVLAGDLRQIPPIDGSALYKEGPYDGTAVNKGENAPSAVSLDERWSQHQACLNAMLGRAGLSLVNRCTATLPTAPVPRVITSVTLRTKT